MLSVFLISLIVYSCKSANFTTLSSNELNEIISFSVFPNKQKFSLINRKCSESLSEFGKHQIEVDTVNELKFIIKNNLNDATFNNYSKIIQSITNHLIKIESKPFYNQLPSILTDIKLTKRSRRLCRENLFKLFKMMNIHTLSAEELRQETYPKNFTSSQIGLIIASRELAHIWFETHEINSKLVAEGPLSTLRLKSEYKWLDFDDYYQGEFVVKRGPWIYSFVVLYDLFVDRYYNNLSDDIKREMRLKYHFVPWNMAVIQKWKSKIIEMWRESGKTLLEIYYVHYGFEGLITSGVFQMDGDDIFKWEVKWFANIFELLKKERLSDVERQQIQHPDIKTRIIQHAFLHFNSGRIDEFKQLIGVLNDDTLCERLLSRGFRSNRNCSF